MHPSRTKKLVEKLVEKNKPETKEWRGLDDNAIVLVSGVRTGTGRARKGGFKDTKTDKLLTPVLKEIMRRTPNLSHTDVGDIVIGNCLQPGGGQLMARMAMLEAGFPYTVPVASINRQCSSGLQAIATVAGEIQTNVLDIGIAGGVESMSTCPMQDATPNMDFTALKSPVAAACLVPMGITSENIAKKYRISRKEQDHFSLNSHIKANMAREKGFFSPEIVSVGTVNEDEGIRRDCSIQGLLKLKPVFDPKNGVTTAGNSSQTSDGASAVIVSRESTRKKLNLPLLAVWRAYTVVGVPPEVMGIGPAFAIPAVLERAGLQISDIDVFEINEAFASQILFCVNYLSIDMKKVNPYGGAIALGHPLGSSGSRLVVTCAHYLKRNGLRYGCVSLCVGSGMGAAAIIENPDYAPSSSMKSKL